jgi:integrase
MPRRRSNEWRVLGPYEHGQRFRVVVIAPGGTRSDPETSETKSFDTYQRADKFRTETLAELGGALTAERALGLYERFLGTLNLEPVTVETSVNRVRKFFGEDLALPLRDLTPRWGKARYAALREQPKQVWRNPLAEAPADLPKIAVTTHRAALRAGKKFLVWCVDEGHMQASPLEKVKPVGKPNRGKEQLTIDQGRELFEVCLAELEKGDTSALAVLIAAIFGIRASAIAMLQVSDIDDRGRVLIVRRSKTETARWLRLGIPVELRPILAAYTKGRIGRLFPVRDRHWVLRNVKRLCALAGVPEVTTHGLRGTQASTSVEAGATPEMVMRTLAHRSTDTQRRHYVRPGAAETQRAAAAAAALLGGDRDEEAGNETPDSVPSDE